MAANIGIALNVVVFSLIRIITVSFSTQFVSESRTLSDAVQWLGALRAAPHDNVRLLSSQQISFIVASGSAPWIILIRLVECYGSWTTGRPVWSLTAFATSSRARAAAVGVGLVDGALAGCFLLAAAWQDAYVPRSARSCSPPRTPSLFVLLYRESQRRTRPFESAASVCERFVAAKDMNVVLAALLILFSLSNLLLGAMAALGTVPTAAQLRRSRGAVLPRNLTGAVHASMDGRSSPRPDNGAEEMGRSNTADRAPMESRWSISAAEYSRRQPSLSGDPPAPGFMWLLRCGAVAVRISRSLRFADIVSLSVAFRTFRATFYRRHGNGEDVRPRLVKPESPSPCGSCGIQVCLPSSQTGSAAAGPLHADPSPHVAHFEPVCVECYYSPLWNPIVCMCSNGAASDRDGSGGGGGGGGGVQNVPMVLSTAAQLHPNCPWLAYPPVAATPTTAVVARRSIMATTRYATTTTLPTTTTSTAMTMATTDNADDRKARQPSPTYIYDYYRSNRASSWLSAPIAAPAPVASASAPTVLLTTPARNAPAAPAAAAAAAAAGADTAMATRTPAPPAAPRGMAAAPRRGAPNGDGAPPSSLPHSPGGGRARLCAACAAVLRAARGSDGACDSGPARQSPRDDECGLHHGGTAVALRCTGCQRCLLCACSTLGSAETLVPMQWVCKLCKLGCAHPTRPLPTSAWSSSSSSASASSSLSFSSSSSSSSNASESSTSTATSSRSSVAMSTASSSSIYSFLASSIPPSRSSGLLPAP